MTDTRTRTAPVVADELGDPYLKLALWIVCLLGVALRLMHLDIPMRYDESVTYLSYASQGWEHVTTSYQQPNNHVLHSLMVSWTTGWLGDSPFVIRLPAFLAGCALVPAAAWVARLAHSREAGVAAAVLVATSPILIEFSTNARGYSLLSVAVLLAIGAGLYLLNGGRAWMAWAGLIELAVVGFFTLPIMVIPWLGITMWLAASLYRGRRRDEPHDRPGGAGGGGVQGFRGQ
jgi:predicted membrane-bound mannosyltransferase